MSRTEPVKLGETDCLDATDLKLSQLICPAATDRRNDEMIRLGSLAHRLFIQGCPGSFTCLSTEH